MDKQEYKILSEEIMSLVANEKFGKAVKIADKIDWRKVRSFSMLQKISDLYKINRRYEEALEIMLLAYERNHNSRTIVYSLCELYIELNDIIKALQFLSIYKKIAPKDSGAYILQYRILELEDASLEDRIAVLEELKHKDYREEWAYQLAYLYHRVGLATKCVETCDELITWFGDGPFVIKSMELKMLHSKLTPKQQEVYDRRMDIEEEIEAVESDQYSVEQPEPGLMPELGDDDFHVKTIDMSKFNTINLQKALAESMRELMGDEYEKQPSSSDAITNKLLRPMMDGNTSPDMVSDEDIMGKYDNTREMSRNIKENSLSPDGPYEQEMYPEELQEGDEVIYEGEDGRFYYANGDLVEEQLFFEDGTPIPGTGKIDNISDEALQKDMYAQEGVEAEYAPQQECMPETGHTEEAFAPKEAGAEYAPQQLPDEETGEVFFEDKTGDIVVDKAPLGMYSDIVSNAQPAEDAARKGLNIFDVEVEQKPVISDSAYEPKVLESAPSKSQEDDPYAVAYNLNPQQEMLEKQITGQMTIEDMLAGWESIKKSQDQKQKDITHQNIWDKTGPLFLEFEEANKNDLISRLEKEQRDAKRVLNNELELKKAEDVHDVVNGGRHSVLFGNNKYSPDSIEAINMEDNSEGENIIADDKLAAAAGAVVGAVAGVAAGAVAAETAGSAVVGAVAGVAAGAVAAETAGSAVAGAEAGVASAAGAMAGTVTAKTARAVAGTAAEVAGTIAGAEAKTTEESVAVANLGANAVATNTKQAVSEKAETLTPEAELQKSSETSVVEAPEANPEEEAVTAGKISGEEPEAYPEEEPAFAEESSEALPEEETESFPEEMAMSENAPILDTAEINSIGDALEAAADKVGIETEEENNDDYVEDEESENNAEREFSKDELELFADFLYSKKMRKQILAAIDLVSLAPYVGNVIVTGDNSTSVVEMAKDVIKEIQMTDNNFVSKRAAKISGSKMNKKDVASMISQLANGALIIEHAADMTRDTLENITKVLETSQNGIVIVLTDTKRSIDAMINDYEVLTGYFNARIDITPMSNNALVAYAKKYAYGLEYKIDETKAVLALHQRISELQIGEHNVTPQEVEEIVDAAIAHAKRPSLKTYFRILGGKRYDYEDMIILQEGDFVR
ncbi:MAG: tetratricopeptide repeat protein [Lachnospiraceae bacterium]